MSEVVSADANEDMPFFRLRLRRGRALTAAFVVALVMTGVAPASAQESPGSTTQPATTAPPTTAAPTTAAPPAPTASTTPTTTPTSGVPGSAAPGEEETTTTTIDPDNPLEGEGPPETAPTARVTVPPREGGYAAQPDFKPTAVLWGNVRLAEAKVADAVDAHQQSIAQVRSVRLRIKEIWAGIAELDVATRSTFADLLDAQARLERRALSAFIRGDAFAVSPSIDHDEQLQSMVQKTMVESIFEQDKAVIAEFDLLLDQLDVETRIIYQRLELLESMESLGLDDVEYNRQAIEQAELEARVFRAGSAIYIDGVVFPVQGDVEVPLIDSYGFARMTGTPDEHWHEGIDIFAPTGTALVAAERGVVSNIGTGRLGGARLWLRGESGTDWYYAHLSGFAPGLANGQVVEAGDLLGYVGTSGNAVGTPPHLHMQIHPGGGDPVNPYPLLNTVLEMEQEQAQEDALADQR